MRASPSVAPGGRGLGSVVFIWPRSHPSSFELNLKPILCNQFDRLAPMDDSASLRSREESKDEVGYRDEVEDHFFANGCFEDEAEELDTDNAKEKPPSASDVE